MFYLGIDIGKRSHVASLLDEKSKTVFKAFTFSNTSDGCEKLLTQIRRFINSSIEVEISMEATEHY